jgi:hypothetical protein
MERSFRALTGAQKLVPSLRYARGAVGVAAAMSLITYFVGNLTVLAIYDEQVCLRGVAVEVVWRC